MNPKQTDFGEQAFGEQAESLVTVKYEAQQHALDFIWSVLGDGTAVGLIEGPAGSGKSTVLRQFISELPRDAAVAVVDGTRIKPRGLLSEILARYGYVPDLQSTDELLRMIAMFAGQQTRTYQAPILLVDNADQMLRMRVAYGRALIQEGRRLISFIASARVSMPKSTAIYIDKCRRYGKALLL